MKYEIEEDKVRLELTKRQWVLILVGETICWIAAFSMIVWGFFQYHEVTRLQEENILHQRQLEIANQRMRTLEKKLERLDALDSEIRNMIKGSQQGMEPAGGGRTIEQKPLTLAPTTPGMLLKQMGVWEKRANERLISLSMLQVMIRDGADVNMEAFRSGKPLDGESDTPFLRPSNGKITEPFGWRRDPFTGETVFHEGIDIADDYGSPIEATANGRVIRSEWVEGYGNLVEIDHGGGMVTRYGHNSVNMVSAGDKVHAGQVIAFMGSTGHSTGSHVHYEVRINGTAVNPQIFLPAQRPSLLQ